MKITVVVDNACSRPGLGVEHGFAAWIEADGLRFLFDTGQGGVLSANALALGIPLERVDSLVLSHGHYDHTGGLGTVLERAPSVGLVLHRDASVRRFSLRDPVAPRDIGMPEAIRTAVTAHLQQARWVDRPTALSEHVWVTGPIPRHTGYEDVGGPFFLDARGSTADRLDDDQAMWAVTGHGLVVVVGCAHAGIVNTLDHVRAVSGIDRVRAVIGGFHLGDATEERLGATMRDLRRIAPELIAPCHCTGERGIDALRSSFPRELVACGAGSVFEL